MLSFLIFFALAAAHDLCACYWYSLRESGRHLRATGLAMLLELMNWLPVWVAIQQDDFTIAIAAILGSGVGTYLGLVRYERTVVLDTRSQPPGGKVTAPQAAPPAALALRQCNQAVVRLAKPARQGKRVAAARRTSG